MSFPRVLALPPRRPSTGTDRELPRPRLLLGAGAVAMALSLVVWGVWAYLQRGVMWSMLDLSVYHDAAESLNHGGQSRLYVHSFGNWKLPFIYPPFSAWIFNRLLFLGFAGLKWLMALTSLASLFGVVWYSWGLAGYRRGAGRLGACMLTFAAALWFEPVQWTLIWGQVNLVLLLLMTADLAQPDSRRWKGVGVGLAAGIKLTPGIFVVYLLLTRRLRAAAVSVAAFVATMAAGWIVTPTASRAYWPNLFSISGKVNDKLSVGTLNNQSVQGMFSRALSNDHLVTGLWLLVCAVLAVMVLLAGARAGLYGRELLAVVLVGALSLFVSPISWSHHWVWVVPALVLLADVALTTGRRLWAWYTAGFLLFFASWPMSVAPAGGWNARIPLQPFGLIWWAPRDSGREHHWNVWQFLVGNGYLLAGVALVVVVSLRLLREPSAPLPELPAARAYGDHTRGRPPGGPPDSGDDPQPPKDVEGAGVGG